MTSTTTPTIRLRSPGEIAAAVPLLCGFPPTNSVVALSLRGARGRIGLTLRADLVEAPELAEQVVRGMDRDGAESCVVVVYSERPSGDTLAWEPLVAAVEHGLAEQGIELMEALLVRDGSWVNYRCRRSCCPPSGTPVPVDSPAVQSAAAHAVLDGRAVLASREELVASIGPSLPLGAAVVERLQEQAAQALLGQVLSDRSAAVHAERDRWRAALTDWEHRPGRLDPPQAAALTTGLVLVEVRDEVATWSLDHSDALLGLVLAVARSTAPPDDAPVCALLAWLSWARGDGATASIALDRALASDPEHGLAQLLRVAVDGLLPPSDALAVLRGTREDLRGQRKRRRRGR